MTSTLGALALDRLDAVRAAPSFLAAIDLIEPLDDIVADDGHDALHALGSAIDDDTDQLTAIVAVHAAAAGGAEVATALVVPLLTSPVPFLREHAVWALRGRPVLPHAVPALRETMDEGGFIGMLAEATLETWGVLGPDDDDVEDPPRMQLPGADPSGLTIAQLFLHADIDGSLLQAGKGDTGGIATLLVHLGDSLVDDPRVARVLTLSRGRDDGRAPEDLRTPGHHYVGIPLPGPARPAADTWPLRVPIRQGLRRALRTAGPVDVLHLRMADVGSWAAAEVAGELGIRTVLTLAPDPHALIAARQASGLLTRANFGAADHAEHLVFRVILLRELAAAADRLVVFPRPQLERDLRDLLHLDPDAANRTVVVPEGIDLAPLDRAQQGVTGVADGVADAVADDVADGVADGVAVPAATRHALAELDRQLSTLPPERRTLPLAISVGRLHRVKGMATLVEAWASDPTCAARCNLLVVGGDLADPSDDEAEQLARIDGSVPRQEAPERGLLLAGHRPNGVVATWLAAVRLGRAGLCAPGGVYVSASLKEEFGIAILEGMASGLVVVAPGGSGPATYVEHGVTGLLVDTTSTDELAKAVVAALDLAAEAGSAARAQHARDVVTDQFSIGRMASSLATLYSKVTRDAARDQS